MQIHVKTIRIIEASGPDRHGLLRERIKELEQEGFKVLFNETSPNQSWPYTSGSVEDRLKAFEDAMTEDASDAVMWSRGGYGSSDLLPHINWKKIKRANPKPIIGFSDACAAQSALLVHTGRFSLHAPMPGTTLWRQNGDEDVRTLFDILRGTRQNGSITLNPVGKTITTPSSIHRQIFGGCLTVISSLLGTSYLAKQFKNSILFFEDTGENPGRIIRNLNQWHQSGLLDNIAALVLGCFTAMGAPLPDCAPLLYQEVAKRFKVPIFVSSEFGHVSPNFVLPIGGFGSIENGQLKWSISKDVS